MPVRQGDVAAVQRDRSGVEIQKRALKPLGEKALGRGRRNVVDHAVAGRVGNDVAVSISNHIERKALDISPVRREESLNTRAWIVHDVEFRGPVFDAAPGAVRIAVATDILTAKTGVAEQLVRSVAQPVREQILGGVDPDRGFDRAVFARREAIALGHDLFEERFLIWEQGRQNIVRGVAHRLDFLRIGGACHLKKRIVLIRTVARNPHGCGVEARPCIIHRCVQHGVGARGDRRADRRVRVDDRLLDGAVPNHAHRRVRIVHGDGLGAVANQDVGIRRRSEIRDKFSGRQGLPPREDHLLEPLQHDALAGEAIGKLDPGPRRFDVEGVDGRIRESHDVEAAATPRHVDVAADRQAVIPGPKTDPFGVLNEHLVIAKARVDGSDETIRCQRVVAEAQRDDPGVRVEHHLIIAEPRDDPPDKSICHEMVVPKTELDQLSRFVDHQ